MLIFVLCTSASSLIILVIVKGRDKKVIFDESLIIFIHIYLKMKKMNLPSHLYIIPTLCKILSTVINMNLKEYLLNIYLLVNFFQNKRFYTADIHFYKVNIHFFCES